MQRYTIFFIIVNALHVSGGFSAHHQELKNCTHSLWFVPGLLAATDIFYYCQCSTCFGRFLRPSSGAQELYTHSVWYVPGLLAATVSGSSKQAWHIPDAVCVQFLSS